MISHKHRELLDIVSEIRIGWNLGNSLDVVTEEKVHNNIYFAETGWGNPVISSELIKTVINAGFNLIRIPVTWGGKLIPEEDYLIAKDWLDRVEEVVNYAYQEGVYVIIDAHHEDNWLSLGDQDKEKKAKIIIQRLWKQIAKRFQNYDYHLMFETMNETRLIGTEDEWTSGTVEARDTVNDLNIAAIKAIRSESGYNSERIIVIPTYGAKASVEAIKSIRIPQNEKRVILDVHAYTPYEFCMVTNEISQWGTAEDVENLRKFISELSEAAKEKHIPLIIGEFGTINKNNLADRVRYLSTYYRETKRNGVKCIIWDNNRAEAYSNDSYGQIDRNTLRWVFPEIINALMENT